jgi:hypothetical protein
MTRAVSWTSTPKCNEFCFVHWRSEFPETFVTTTKRGMDSADPGRTPNYYSQYLISSPKTNQFWYYWEKVKSSLCLINKALFHDDILGCGGITPPFFTSALDGGNWSASRPGRFTSGEIVPQYPLDERLGGPQSRSRRYSKVVPALN